MYVNNCVLEGGRVKLVPHALGVHDNRVCRQQSAAYSIHVVYTHNRKNIICHTLIIRHTIASIHSAWRLFKRQNVSDLVYRPPKKPQTMESLNLQFVYDE